MNLWWLSFCDTRKPRGTQFIGGCIVPASGTIAAVRMAHFYGINPGGEVAGAPVNPALEPKDLEEWSYRLLSPVEVVQLDARMTERLRRAGR